jgi:hypothetical protein
VSPDARRPRSGSSDQGQQRDEAGEDFKRASTLHAAADTATPPRCAVVGAHCEALGWLAREPYRHAHVCCRHYWADVEGVAS